MIVVPQGKITEYTSCGWWGATTLWDLFVRNLQQRPDADAVLDASNRADFAHGAPQRLSWHALADAVDRFCLLLIDSGIHSCWANGADLRDGLLSGMSGTP